VSRCCDFCEEEVECSFVAVDSYHSYDNTYSTTRYCADHYKEWREMERLALYRNVRGTFVLFEGRDCGFPSDGRVDRHGCYKAIR
jgi:hypothetical protein